MMSHAESFDGDAAFDADSPFYDDAGQLRLPIAGMITGRQACEASERLEIEVVLRVVQNRSGPRVGARQVAEAPRVHLNHFAGVLDLQAGMNERRDPISPPRRILSKVPARDAEKRESP